jgi:two-component system, NtrC family, sensor kinase
MNLANAVDSAASTTNERVALLEEALRTLGQMGKEAFLFFGPDRKISWANPQLTALTGYSESDLLGRDVLTLFHSSDQDLIRDLIQSPITRTDLKAFTPVGLETALGGVRKVEIRFVSKADPRGGQTIYGCLRDISIPLAMAPSSLDIQQTLQKIIEMGNDGILVIDQDYRVEFANQLASDITGLTNNQLVGSDFRSLLSPEDRWVLAALPTQMRLNANENRRVSTQFKIITASGAPREVEICLTLAYLEGQIKTYAYLRDLSDRIRMETELRKTNNFLKNIILSSVDGIISADTKGRIVIFNQGAQRMLGYTAEEALRAVHIKDIYTPGLGKEIMKKLRSPDFGGPGKLNNTLVSLVTRSGEVFPANLSAALIYDEAGQEMASVGIFTDLRERVRLQRELEEAHLKLLQSEKMASLGKLAAGVAHEINNPLGGILMYATILLEDTPLKDPRRQDLQEIVDQTLRCKDIVQGLLDFSRQTRHRWVMTDLNQSIRQTIALLGGQALFHNIQLVEELDPDLPPLIADPGRVNQILTNLIINAIDGMNASGTLTLRTYPLPDSGKIGLEISDTGCGIPAENLSRIFEPFFTTKEVGQGTGLGLSTVYGLVEEHGGTIEVQSQVGKGTTFIIRLPVEGPPSRKEAKESAEQGFI